MQHTYLSIENYTKIMNNEPIKILVEALGERMVEVTLVRDIDKGKENDR